MNITTRSFHKAALSICIAALLSPSVMVAEEVKKDESDVERMAVTGSSIMTGSANFSSSTPITEVNQLPAPL